MRSYKYSGLRSCKDSGLEARGHSIVVVQELPEAVKYMYASLALPLDTDHPIHEHDGVA